MDLVGGPKAKKKLHRVEKKTLDLKVTLKDMVMHMLLSMGAGRIIRFLTYG